MAWLLTVYTYIILSLSLLVSKKNNAEKTVDVTLVRKDDVIILCIYLYKKWTNASKYDNLAKRAVMHQKCINKIQVYEYAVLNHTCLTQQMVFKHLKLY